MIMVVYSHKQHSVPGTLTPGNSVAIGIHSPTGQSLGYSCWVCWI